KVNGVAFEWHENGQKKTEKTYKNGIAVKTVKYDEDGMKSEINMYEKSKVK
ncbi:MAG: toxin-antitoxin system YwqK family antitoxin, partial [Bacteroidetes bacterium]|nr:toxin-antitoxin system YwqK family antitoxin [Bacteroidota bacterium]